MTYPGGKSSSGVYQRIINQLPPHDLYIEPFLGSGAIMRFKRPARSSIGIDIDGEVIAAFSDHASRIPGCTLICDDAISWLSVHNIPDYALVYLDPPYLLQTLRSGHQRYRYKFIDEQHWQLLQVICKLDCMIAISGYPSGMYEDFLSDWRMITYQARTRGLSSAVECLWMNYSEPKALHDYRYLGSNYRERERIKRMQERWRQRLHDLNPLERYAMLSVIDQFSSSKLAGIDDA
jgi:site-specific DNA-adenine methylase